MVSCRKFKNLISYYIDNECSVSQRQQLADHIKECRDCKTEFEAYSHISSILKQLKPLHPSDEYIVKFNERFASCFCGQSGKTNKNYILYRKNFIRVATAAMVAMFFIFSSMMFLFDETKKDAPYPMATYIKGGVSISNGSNFIKQARLKSKIYAGQVISTGNYGKIDIEYQGRFKMTLKENTVVKIHDLSEINGQFKLKCDLNTGVMLADINRKKKLSDIRINTKVVNVRVCGTKFMVESSVEPVNKRETVGVAVLDGKVEVLHDIVRRNKVITEKHYITENQKMVFESNNNAYKFNKELSSDDFESLLEVYDISKRDVDIKYQSGQPNKSLPFRSESFE